PEKKPLLPRWDILVWEHGTRKVQIRPLLGCNWLQAEENTADFVHTFFLHGWTTMRKNPEENVGFFTRPFARYGFQPCPWGIVKKGGDPMALVWDDGQNACINLEGWGSPRDVARAGIRSTDVHGVDRIPKKEIFGAAYERVEVPYGTARPQP